MNNYIRYYSQGMARVECVYPFTTDWDITLWEHWNPLIGIWNQGGEDTWEWRN